MQMIQYPSVVEMRSRWLSHTKKPKNAIPSRKAELRKDEGKMVHRQRHQGQALEGTRLKYPRVFAGREVLRAGWTSLRASFTVSPQEEYQCCVWFFCGLFVGAVFVAFLCH